MRRLITIGLLLVSFVLGNISTVFAGDPCDQDCCRNKNLWPEVFYLDRLNVSGNMISTYNNAVMADIVGYFSESNWNIVTDRKMLNQNKVAYGSITMMVQAHQSLNRQRRTVGTSAINISNTSGEATVNLVLVATVTLPSGETKTFSAKENKKKTFPINSSFRATYNYNISIFGRRQNRQPQTQYQQSDTDYNVQESITALYDEAFASAMLSLMQKMNNFRQEKSS